MHSSPNCQALARCSLPIDIFASSLLGVSSRCCLAPSLPVAASRCCLVPSLLGKCFPACSRFPARSGFPMALCIGTSAGSCFPMLPQRLPLEHLPRSSFRTAATRGAVTSSAQTSASLHPPAALRLRVLPFTRAWTPTVCAEEFPTPLEMSLPGQVRRSCKSPRAQILVLGTSGAHWPARWPQFVLTERVDKS